MTSHAASKEFSTLLLVLSSPVKVLYLETDQEGWALKTFTVNGERYDAQEGSSFYSPFWDWLRNSSGLIAGVEFIAEPAASQRLNELFATHNQIQTNGCEIRVQWTMDCELDDGGEQAFFPVLFTNSQDELAYWLPIDGWVNAAELEQLKSYRAALETPEGSKPKRHPGKNRRKAAGIGGPSAHTFWVRLMYQFPLALTVLRLILAPIVVLLSGHPHPLAFGFILTAAVLSDIFDGVLARRLGVATAALRRLDSAVDIIFYLAVGVALWRLRPEVVRAHGWLLVSVVGLELLRLAFDRFKYGLKASYHLWSAKAWGLALFIGALMLLSFDGGSAWFGLMLWPGVFENLEGFAVSLLLAKWTHDVPTVFHAARMRASFRQGGA